jgi:DNA polymerase-3 subunit delta
MTDERVENPLDGLEKSLASGRLLPVYLLVGEEQYFRHRGRELIRDVVVKQHKGTVSVFGTGDALERVLEELRGDSLFVSRRMVELIEADGFLKEWHDAVARYLERPSASGVLVMDAHKVDNRTRLVAKVRKSGMLIPCPRMYEGGLAGWVKAQVARRGLKISGSAVSLLIDEVGNNLFALAGEMEKLITYVGERERIEASDVAHLTGHTRSWIVWALTDALGRREAPAALRVLDSLLDEGTRAESIVGSLNWQITRLWKARCMTDSGRSRRDILGELHVPFRYADAVIEQVGRFARGDFARVIRMLLDADIALKTGGLPEKTVLERFLVEACETPR